VSVIHLTGSIALFLLGGALVAIGLVVYSSCLNISCVPVAENPIALVMLLLGIGMVSGGVAVAKAASKPTQEILEEYGSEELKDYERDYLARQGIKSTSRKPTARRKPAETRESESNFCDNCGKSLRPTAKFCGSCGTSVP